ncbi:MAG TPA: phage integrase SAM-like domain-containing protein [Ktedonobacteraceae bacterium]|nr:phage integrase SAM-like domain-containing protein [Ktedonobacteraceae bacterium]
MRSRPQAGQTTRLSTKWTGSQQRRTKIIIERAIGDYLQEQKRRKRQPKTLEWHQTALGLFQQYLQRSHQCLFIDQITQAHVQSWLTFLGEQPTARGKLRSADTTESYTRSVRAFCQ